LTDTEGRSYGFDTNYAKGQGYNVPEVGNTLFTDPAIMAFIRASGQTIETAANQVRQQTGAINAALQTTLGDIDFNAGENKRKTHGSFESRGVSRGSSHQHAQDVVERNRLAAQTSAQNTAATQIGNLNSGLVNTVLGQQQKAAELGLTTGQNQDWDATQQSIKQKYAPELAAGGMTV
ncbi:MAG TPA: hypothetical protein VEA79_12965, partial [Phenylobacterium sp.]|nr:hypothetical protein [Phenylobacterium sp.]